LDKPSGFPNSQQHISGLPRKRGGPLCFEIQFPEARRGAQNRLALSGNTFGRRSSASPRRGISPAKRRLRAQRVHLARLPPDTYPAACAMLHAAVVGALSLWMWKSRSTGSKMTRSEIIASCRKGAEMTAKVIQIRDYRRKEEKLKRQAAEILKQIDTGDELYRSQLGPSKPYQAPPEDCA
jgi:hypothetical protein